MYKQQALPVTLCAEALSVLPQLQVYLLEAGLSHPDFLSEGSGRMKKANQLIQKLMEHFYDFIIPGQWQIGFNPLFVCFTIVFRISCDHVCVRRKPLGP